MNCISKRHHFQLPFHLTDDRYNCGHLLEGALAHQDHYNDDRFMEPMLKYVNLLCSKFGPGPEQSHGYPGHPEIELALLRLYDRTKEQKHLDLAKYFITERGNAVGEEGRHFYDVETERRGDDEYRRPSYYPTPRAYWCVGHLFMVARFC